jgi:glycosyltransferase involved in cell wall biosynthesis
MAQTPDTATPGAIRVVRLFSRLNIGGPAIHVILLTAGLEQRGYRTRLVVGKETPREGNMLSLAAAKGVRCEAMAGLGREIQPVADFRAFLGLVRLIREFRPSIVHTHTAKAGLLGRLAARFAGVPVVVHTFHGHVLRGYFGPVKTAVFRRLETVLGGMADALVAVSEAVKQDLVTLGVADRERIRVVPLGLDLEPLTGSLPRGGLRTGGNVPADAPLVGIVGRLVPIKDVPTFLEAAMRVRRSRPGCRFAVVGDGEERARLEERARGLGLGDAVTFHGWHADMSVVYGDLDVVVNCSRNEGTPVALIEALAAARPVVATRVGGTPDVLGEDERGLLVAPGDPDALARAILETLRDPDAARARALAGRRYVLESHSSARLVCDIDALYRELLAAKEVAA